MRGACIVRRWPQNAVSCRFNLRQAIKQNRELGLGLHSAEAVPAAQTEPFVPHDEALIQALAAWRTRLGGVGVACRYVAFHALDAAWCVDFPAEEAALQARWATLWPEVTAHNPAAMAKMQGAGGADLLLAAAVQGVDGRQAVVGVSLAPPYNDRTVQMVLLSLGWLQVALTSVEQVQRVPAAQMVDMMAHVASQDGARMAAQEWVNRTAAMVRGLFDPASAPGVSLMAFQLVRGAPRWWVAAETAWAETGAPAVQAATELATQAAVTLQEVQQEDGWALPIMDRGRPVAVLVAQVRGLPSGRPWPAELGTTLRASVSLAEPLLRRWDQSERSLWRHGVAALAAAWRRVAGPGHLTWKAVTVLGVVVLAVLLFWPVPDRVKANIVIEGRKRQLVTSPFDGFIAEVMARPGEVVRKGQVLARLDDRDVKLDLATQRSAREQASGKLRQALAERDASAVALAQAELQQTEAQLALAETRLARTALIAPMDGLLVKGDWMQQVGSPVDTGKEMFEIANTDGYRVVLHVPDADIARVRVGQQGHVRLTGHPQSAYPFRINRVTATASVSDSLNGFRVEAAWVGAVPPLSPGMQGVGKIDVGQNNLLTIWTRSSLNWLRLKLWAWLW